MNSKNKSWDLNFMYSIVQNNLSLSKNSGLLSFFPEIDFQLCVPLYKP